MEPDRTSYRVRKINELSTEELRKVIENDGILPKDYHAPRHEYDPKMEHQHTPTSLDSRHTSLDSSNSMG